MKSRLSWQCRRGLLELDLLCHYFLNHDYDKAKKQEQEAFEKLLTYTDTLLLDWLYGKVSPPKDLAVLINRLRNISF